MAKVFCKSISSHEGVLECLDGFEQNFDSKYDVFLKEGWEFTYGRMTGGRCGTFNTVEEFKEAEPRRV